MATVTAIETQQHDDERVSIYLDGVFAFGLPRIVQLARRVAVGQELSSHDVERLRRDDAVERALATALNVLSYRPRSRREIERHLARKEVDTEVIQGVLTRLQELGLVNDSEFARFWLENRQTFRPRGARALRAELRLKGLDSEVIETALEETLGDEEEDAYRAGRRKAEGLAGGDEREFFRKLIAFLQRRGFAYAVASSASRRLWQELTMEDPEVDLAE